MIQERYGVFETNSSSTHCIVISPCRNPKENVLDIVDNVIHARYQYFGWDYFEYRDCVSKLNYLIAMIFELAHFNEKGLYVVSKKTNIYELEAFKELEKKVCDYTGCEKIVVDNWEPIEIWQSDTRIYYEYEGGIDHQSFESFSSLEDFFKRWDKNGDNELDVIKFIFDPSVVLVTKNDNEDNSSRMMFL